MSNTDFDPDAYLSGPAAAPAPPPAAPAATPAPKQDSGFDPNAYLAQPAGGFDPDAYLKSAPSSPTPHQAYRASVKALAAAPPEQPAGVGAPEPADFTTERVPAAELAKEWGNVAYGVPKGAAAFPAGGFLGDVESLGRHVVGANPNTYFPSTVEGGYLGPKGLGLMNPAATPEEAIGMGVGAMLVPGPKLLKDVIGGKPVEAPPGVPPVLPPALAPERNPLGVTLTQGEADANLAARLKEQAAVRSADPHAQAFVAQRAEQLAQARENIARGLDPTGSVVAESPLDAADIVSQDLVRREELARTGRQNEAARLAPPELPHPLDSAEVVVNSLRNSADTLTQSQQARDVALQNTREGLRTSLSPTGTVVARTPMEAADIVSHSVSQAAENAQAATAQAYEQLRTLPGQFHPASFNTVGAEIEASLNKGSNPIRLSPQKTPEAQAAVNDLDDILSGVTQQRDPETGQIIKKPPLTPQVIEEARKRLNSFYGNALQTARASNDWSDVRATRGVMDAFDDAVIKRLTDGRYIGGNAADVASTMKWARGLHAQYRKTFTSQGAGDAVGSAVQQIVGRYEGQAAPPNQIQGMLYGNGPLPVKIAKRLNSVFGSSSPEIGAVKQGLFSSIIEKPEGVTAWGPSQVADRIYDFLNGKGKALADEYLTPIEKTAWKSYADNLRASVVTPPQPGDVVARAIGQITGIKGTPSTLNEIADTLYGRAGVGENPLGAKLAQHIRDTYGEASEPFKAIRNGMAAKLLRTAEGRLGWDPKGIANSIDEFLNGRGKTMANTLYSPEEQTTWRSYADALRQHAASDVAPNTPVARAIARISGADGRPPATPAEVRELLWKRSLAQDKEVPIGVAKYLKNLWGETSPQWSALKQGLWSRMTEPGGDLAAWGPGKSANQISRFMAIDGRDLASIMFTPEERASIRAYADLQRKIEMPPGTYFPSSPGIAPLMSTVANRIGQLIGAVIGRSLTPSVPIVGEFAGITIGGKMEKAIERWHNNVKAQMPIIADEMQKWQQAQARFANKSNWATQKGIALTTTALQKSLAPLGIDLNKLPQLPTAKAPFQLQGPGTAGAEPNQQQRAAGGGVQGEGNSEWDQIVNPVTGRPRIVITPGVDTPDNPASPASAPQSPVETLNGSGLGHPSGLVGKGLEQASEGESAPPEAQPPPIESVPGVGAVPASSDTDYGNKSVNRLLGAGGEERYQTWPERMIRSGTTLAGDVMSGQTPIVDPITGHTSDEVIQRAQDMAALAGGAGMPSAEEGALGMAGGKLPSGWQSVEGGATAARPTPQQLIQFAGITPERWFQLKPIDRELIEKGYLQKTAQTTTAVTPPKELTVKQLYTPQEMLKRGEQFDIPDPSKLAVQSTRTFGDNPQDLFFVTQPDPVYASYAPHVTRPITAFNTRAEAEGFIRAAQQQQRPADYAGPKLYSDTQQPGAALSALEHTQPFYSAVEQAITNAPQQKMHGSQWFNWLKNQPGIKQEELDWLGLKDNPDLQGLQTKQQMLEHVQGQGVGLKEVEKSGEEYEPELKFGRGERDEENPEVTRYDVEDRHNGDTYTVHSDSDAGNVSVETPDGKWLDVEALTGVPLNRQDINTAEEAIANHLTQQHQGQGGPTKYSDYQLPGGDNYRELLLTMPNKNEVKWGREEDNRLHDLNTAAHQRSLTQAEKAELNLLQNQRNQAAEEDAHPSEGNYHSSHWDEPNVLAHLRMNDRDIPGVGKSLHLEEAQSDLHQAGRKRGYKDPNIEQMGNDPDRDLTTAQFESVVKNRDAVPNFPFKQSWPDLLLKRAITKAAREGKDAISWTPGEQQAARYDLSKHISEIHYTGSNLKAYDHNGQAVISRTGVRHQDLPNIIGKEAAEKLMAQKLEEPNTLRSLRGVDLKVGGEGMKSFYDSTLVNKANAIGKKYGARVEWKPLNVGRSVDQIDEDLLGLAKEVKSRENLSSRNRDAWEGGFGGVQETYWEKHPELLGRRTQLLTEMGKAEDGKYYQTGITKVPVLRLTPQLKQQALTRGMPLFSDTSKPGAALSGLEKSQLKVLTGLPDDKFLDLAQQIGSALNRNRAREDQLRQSGFNEEANKIYLENKEEARRIFQSSGLTAKQFDKRLQKLAPGRRLNVKLERMGFASGGSVKTQPNQQHIPRPVSHQQNNRQPQHLQGFAAGGRVDPTQIDRNPSAAQIKSGTYSKDHIHLHGLAVTIENAKGSTRSGVDKNGRQWTSILPAHYGYLRKHPMGNDGDHLDVYLGPHTKAPHVFIIDQLDKDTKKYDEAKIGIGFGSKNQFVQTYKRAFNDGKASARIGAVHSMTLSQFKSWLEHGDTTVPYKEPEHKKLSHKFVGYEPIAAKPNRHCGVCHYFISAEHNGPACTLVENPIDPGAWCRRFRRKT